MRKNFICCHILSNTGSSSFSRCSCCSTCPSFSILTNSKSATSFALCSFLQSNIDRCLLPSHSIPWRSITAESCSFSERIHWLSSLVPPLKPCAANACFRDNKKVLPTFANRQDLFRIMKDLPISHSLYASK